MPTKIPWTDETWNPVVGCIKVSAGCKFCYAEKMAVRQAYMGNQKYQRVVESDEDDRSGENVVNAPKVSFYGWNGLVFCDESVLAKPLHWRKPRRIFVCSMGDLFHESVPFDFILRVWQIIAKCPQHTFQILTKRPKRVKDFIYQAFGVNYEDFMSPSLWLGVTAENQKCADERIPILLQIPAAVRFVSIEPMLEGMNLFNNGTTYDIYLKNRIDWVIIGCESGSNRRPCKLEWVRDLVAQCKEAGVAVFVKQLNINGKVVKDIKQFPKKLQIREYPK